MHDGLPCIETFLVGVWTKCIRCCARRWPCCYGHTRGQYDNDPRHPMRTAWHYRGAGTLRSPGTPERRGRCISCRLSSRTLRHKLGIHETASLCHNRGKNSYILGGYFNFSFILSGTGLFWVRLLLSHLSLIPPVTPYRLCFRGKSEHQRNQLDLSAPTQQGPAVGGHGCGYVHWRARLSR